MMGWKKTSQWAVHYLRRRALFSAVFGLGICPRLPLHVRGRIGTALVQRLNMIDNVAGAGAGGSSSGRTGMTRAERTSGS
jgi:hypothetical protein